MVSIEDFGKVELCVGQIVAATIVPDTDKLLRLEVDVGEEKPRQIISGIAGYFPDPVALEGKQCIFATNLEPKVIRGLESQGMILAVTADEEQFSLVVPERPMPPGSRIR
jgi:methionyl-tRNA synthetase